MSSDMMLKVVVGMDTPRGSGSVPPSKVQNASTANKGQVGQAVAANGDALPQGNPTDNAAKVDQVVSQINELVQSLNRDLQFTVDKDSGRTVIKVLDSETKEVIRQIPPEELLKIANTITDGKSLLVKERA